MKLDVARAQAKVRGEFYEEGSVRANTVRSGCTRISLDLDIDSSAQPADIRNLVQNAERMCFVSRVISTPLRVELSVTHNGERMSDGDSTTSSEGSTDETLGR
jgi:organic hydroperoxide reductase OsmC/OhrA